MGVLKAEYDRLVPSETPEQPEANQHDAELAEEMAIAEGLVEAPALDDSWFSAIEAEYPDNADPDYIPDWQKEAIALEADAKLGVAVADQAADKLCLKRP